MSKKSPRFMYGVDVWICQCGQANLMGRTCKCGKTNADKLCAENHAEKEEAMKRKTPRKPYVPKETSGSGLIESFYYRKDNEK